ncbi:MAG: phosphonoacetaldehyde reductase [Candidatus Sericytochromatia bacterium]
MPDSIHPALCFGHHQPVAIHFGRGCLDRLPALLAQLPAADRVLLLSSPGAAGRGWLERIQSLLPGRPLEIYTQLAPEPDLTELDALLPRLRAALRGRPAQLLACGGGSVMDAAKALAMALLQDQDFSFAGWAAGVACAPLASLPVVALPTTAGAGSEVTPFAALWDHGRRRKYSLDDPALFPALALVDPDLSGDLPALLRLSTGLDAIVQAFEAIWNRAATPLSTLWASEALRLGLPALAGLCHHEGQPGLQEQMQLASLLAGLAISQTHTALCHAISYPLSAWLGVPHGLACAFSLQAVWRYNLAGDDGRLLALARKLGHQDAAALDDWLAHWLDGLELARWLAPYFSGSPPPWPELIAQMQVPGRSDRNLRPLGTDDLEALCRDSLVRIARIP